MILTNNCKLDFLKENSFATQLLPEYLKNLAIYRWFNTKTNIAIDIQHWANDGYDYAVTDPYVDKVYQSRNKADYREKNFDKNLEEALEKANSVYNGLKY